MPTRREIANVIRVLSMDAVQKAKLRTPWDAYGYGRIAEDIVE